MMKPNQNYINHLIVELEARAPDRQVVSTHSNDLMYAIYDIQKGFGPLNSFDELYRDSIHLDRTVGQYLMHNAMRIGLGKQTSSNTWILLSKDIWIPTFCGQRPRTFGYTGGCAAIGLSDVSATLPHRVTRPLSLRQSSIDRASRSNAVFHNGSEH